MFETPDKQENQSEVTPSEFAVSDQEVSEGKREQIELEYTPFDPKSELAQIEKIDDHEQKEVALERFKRLHRWQQFVLSKLYEDISSELSANPDTSKEIILNRIDKVAKDGRFTRKQIKAARSGVDAYYRRRKNLNEVLESHPNADSLFEYVTNRKPKGDVEVKIDGVTIYFRCFNDEDYARIYNTKFSESELSQEEIAQADKTGGVSVHGGPDKISGAITAEKASKDSLNSYIFNHEREHAIQRLIKGYINFEFGGGFEPVNLSEASSIKEVRKKTRKYLHQTWLPGIEEKMKDEIIAYLKGSNEGVKETKLKLMKAPEEGGLYWPSEENIERRRSTLRLSFFDHNLDGKKINKVIDDELDKALDNHLENIIVEGIAAFRSMQSYGYSDRQISSMLMSKPLSKWMKVAERMT